MFSYINYALTTSAIHQLLSKSLRKKAYNLTLLHILISFSIMQLPHMISHNAVHAQRNCQYCLLKHKYNVMYM